MFLVMLLLDFQSQLSVAPCAERFLDQGVDITLTAGGHLAFSTYAENVEIRVRRGRVWLTDGPVDHVLSGFQSHTAPMRTRVVITALTDAVLTIGPAGDR